MNMDSEQLTDERIIEHAKAVWTGLPEHWWENDRNDIRGYCIAFARAIQAELRTHPTAQPAQPAQPVALPEHVTTQGDYIWWRYEQSLQTRPISDAPQTWFERGYLSALKNGMPPTLPEVEGCAAPQPAQEGAEALRRIVSLVTWDDDGAVGPVVEGLSWESVARMALDIAHHASPPPSPKTGEGSAIEGAQTGPGVRCVGRYMGERTTYDCVGENCAVTGVCCRTNCKPETVGVVPSGSKDQPNGGK
jgi:hypothetical protein